MDRAARRTLNPSFLREFEHLSQIAAAKRIAEQSGGIENLIFWLGANNCLGTVIDLEIRWSEAEDLQRLAHQQTCNLWHPEHFQQLLDRYQMLLLANLFGKSFSKLGRILWNYQYDF